MRAVVVVVVVVVGNLVALPSVQVMSLPCLASVEHRALDSDRESPQARGCWGLRASGQTLARRKLVA